jgi:hypothetical protein
MGGLGLDEAQPIAAENRFVSTKWEYHPCDVWAAYCRLVG